MTLLRYSLEKLLDCNLAFCLRKIKLSSHQATSLYKLIGFNSSTSLHFYKTAWEMTAGNTKESSMGSQLQSKDNIVNITAFQNNAYAILDTTQNSVTGIKAK